MLQAMRRMAVILVLLATASLLAARGSSRHAAAAAYAATTTGAHAGGITGASTGGGRPLTKAQARAFARAVNLRAKDVPGFRASSKHEHEHETAAEKRLEGQLLRCVGGASSSKGLAEASSTEFEHEISALNQSVSSSVTVARTPALAAKELAAIRSDRFRGCLSHYIDLLFKSLTKYRGATFSPVAISQGSPPAPGTTGTFGWRITTTLTLHGLGVPFYMDIFGFVYGHAEVSLFTFGIPQPFPAATEQRLFSLLVERAKAHSA